MPASSVNGQTLTGRPRLVMVCQFKYIFQPFTYIMQAGDGHGRQHGLLPVTPLLFVPLAMPGHLRSHGKSRIQAYYGPILCAMLCRLCPTQTQTMKQEKFGSSAHMRGPSPEVIRAYGEGFGLGFKALYGHDMDMERCLLTIPVRPLPYLGRPNAWAIGSVLVKQARAAKHAMDPRFASGDSSTARSMPVSGPLLALLQEFAT